jgi:hypothetical protein
MTCLKYEAILAIAQGAVPEGELMQIQAHLSICMRCRQAIAGTARLCRRRAHAPIAPPTAPPRTRTVFPSGPGPLVRRGTVFLAGVTLATCLIWKTPGARRVLPWFENILALSPLR